MSLIKNTQCHGWQKMVIGSALQILNQSQNIDKLFIKGQTRERDPLVKLLSESDKPMEKDDAILFSIMDQDRLTIASEKQNETSDNTGRYIDLNV